MRLHVTRGDDGPRLAGSPADGVEVVNRFLVHLSARSFAPATVRAYAFDLLNFLRFCAERQLTLDRVVAADLFDYLERFHNPRMRRRVARQDLKFSALTQPSAKTG